MNIMRPSIIAIAVLLGCGSTDSVQRQSIQCPAPFPNAPSKDALGFTGPIDECPDAGVPLPSLACDIDPGDAMALEVFGDGSDGDLTIPPGGAPIVLTRDMNWRNVFAPPGTSLIDPRGFVVRIKGTLSAPTIAADSGPPLVIFQRVVDNIGVLPEGTIGGPVGHGGSGGLGSGFSGTFLPGAWPSIFGPGSGGAGGDGGALGAVGGAGTAGSILPASAGSMDLFSAIRMRLQIGDAALGGGGGGGGGGGDNHNIGAFGGTGGGNIVVIVHDISNAQNVKVSARGNNGRDAFNSLTPTADTGGGGGGGGGIATVVIFRPPFPVVDVSGGIGGAPMNTGDRGTDGAPGTFLPFCFLISQ